MANPPVIGVAGCGAMGLPMARRLQAAGFETWGLDVRPLHEFGDFQPRMVTDPADFAGRIDVVVSVVRDRKQTFDLLFDDQAILTRAARPNTVVVSSTLSPRVLPEIAARLPAKTALVDAPMSGAPIRAEDGTLTFMVGGADDDIARLMPAFQAMGGVIHHMGATGTGMTCKVINNFVGVSGVVTVRKALKAATALGLEHDRLLEVMRTSSGSTWYGDNIDRISWSREGYDPANTIGILEKDMRAFLDAVEGRDDVAVDDFAAAVLDVVRRLEPLER
jgi:3-hydroxyisobutyrate dehydrogenase-like beta-hydroxyacid dehydrogenase